MHLWQKKKKMFMKITVLISVTNHMVIAGICNFLLPLLFPFAFTKHLSWSWLFTWWGDSNLHS